MSTNKTGDASMETGMTKSSNAPSSTFIKMAANHKLPYAKNTACPLMLSADGLSNTQPLKRMMAKSLPQSRLRSFKNAMPSSRRNSSY